MSLRSLVRHSLFQVVAQVLLMQAEMLGWLDSASPGNRGRFVLFWLVAELVFRQHTPAISWLRVLRRVCVWGLIP